MGMGLTAAEQVATEYNVSRAEQDEFAHKSHMKAMAARENGRFKDEIVPLEIEEVTAGANGPVRQTVIFDTDEHIRPETTVEGGQTAPRLQTGRLGDGGNSSPLSDGAAAVIVMERKKAEALGLTPLVKFVGFNVGGVRP
ncbi:MAG: hypothetical protein M5U34_26335 [Chloroflexi bacterium]|nr:hypothetical protein [Chloroflexota bacterium]